MEYGLKKTMTKTALSSVSALYIDEETMQLPILANPISRARDYIISLQQNDGYWQATFEMDVRQTAEYVFLKHFFDDVDIEEERKMLGHILKLEKPEGGWSIYPDGPVDISTTVTAYYALKLGGYTVHSDVLKRNREIILSYGGIMEANCFTRGYLELFGQMHQDSLPAMPVEIMLFPKWFPFNIYAVSSWSRGIMIPLFVISAIRQGKAKPIAGPSCDELYLDPEQKNKQPIKRSKQFFSWHNFFLFMNNAIKMYEKLPFKPFRKLAIEKAHKWIADHMGREGGLGAIFPSMVNSCIALKHLGYDSDHPLIRNEMKAIKDLVLDEGDTAWVQPCVSTVWDTVWCLNLLPQLGVSKDSPFLVRSKDFLLEKQVGEAGDWQEKIPPVPCGGWYFEMENALYPDNDDTAAALMALFPYRHEEKVQLAVKRAIRWLFAMQCKDGGWAAFDYQARVYECFNYIPFAEHGALLDPPTADVTARVMEALARWGYTINDRQIKRAVKWLEQNQEEDGSWYGRWGVNYIYGTWAVLCGLEAVGYDMQKSNIKKAVDWLLNCQQRDGGWGETCESYTNSQLKGCGESTPSQTAWALMGLDASGYTHHHSVQRGVDFLIRNQQTNGSWQEKSFTGTGFPGVCYLKYHLYKDTFPALALAKILPKVSPQKIAQ